MNYTNEKMEELRQIGINAVNARIEEWKLEADKIEPNPKPWPQSGDHYLHIYDGVEIGELPFSMFHEVDAARLSVGNVYRPEHRAYAERHVEAMKVQAELRRMPGVCAPVEFKTYFLRTSSFTKEFEVCWLQEQHFAENALAGVHFSTQNQAQYAFDTITQDRLALFRDDYLQAPISVDVVK